MLKQTPEFFALGRLLHNLVLPLGCCAHFARRRSVSISESPWSIGTPSEAIW